ncbi:hypothetical protein MKK65_29645 [Methylobacterium sp. J-001]|uniref:hypothetical protein n=1 Tax=Methylobacterium sp. J-001 TaxID=2836609 RepID=UPI001FBBAADB|nr:hypothetical protein [Methylobacterium sp. J-001]MCJ2120672.1 hypothetical protein [Methylobacterium sp. J-001]
MPRRQIITQAAIARAVKGAQAAGLKVGRVEIEGGKIVLYSGEDVRPEPASKLDAWRASRDAR